MIGTKHISGRSRAASRGFTLTEVIVAVAILAIIGVVVGSIFASVGDTVTNGRQLSNLNRFIARTERVMRRDFENMVRENGFMVIRNEISHDYTGQMPAQQDVGLTATDGNPRPRRIDEIMFFSRGDFTSRRSPLHPDMVARANVARVYYGHGQQMPEDFGNPAAPDYTTRYARPRLDETMTGVEVNGASVDSRLGIPSGLGVVNPNEFASDWSLLRHVTLLTPRSLGVQDVPTTVFELRPIRDDGAYYQVADSSRQVALGPATQSIFKSIAATVPYEYLGRSSSSSSRDDWLVYNPPSGFSIRQNELSLAFGGGGVDGTQVRPLPMSGVVDVAVTDLDEIRRTVMNTVYDIGGVGEVTPLIVVPSYAYASPSRTRSVLDSGQLLFDTQGNPLVGTTQLDYLQNGVYFGDPPLADQAQQRWMLDALPSVAYDEDFAQVTGQRMRYQTVPPRVFLDDGSVSKDPVERRRAAIEQADQEMLASSVFVPRCTEFIVEFSFGIVDRRVNEPTYGQQIWHGLRRLSNGRVVVDRFGTDFAGQPLVEDSQTFNNQFAIRGAFPASSFEDGNRAINPIAPGTGTLLGLDQELIDLVLVRDQFALAPATGMETIAEHCFGYSYRDWNLDSPDDTDSLAAGDEDDADREWPWPTMVRITMRFVDPADLEDEQTYQFEFRVPGVGGRL